MKVDLKKSLDNVELQKGDILIFSNGDEYDEYLVVKSNIDKDNPYQLVSLHTSAIDESYPSLDIMLELLVDEENIENDFRLIEILKPSEVVLRRVSDE